MYREFYVVFYVGTSKSGEWKDGQTLYVDNDERRAVEFAREFERANKDDFDDVCGGVGISLADGTSVEW